MTDGADDTCHDAAGPVTQHQDQQLQPPVVQLGLPLLGVEADHPAAAPGVGGVLPVRDHAGPEDGV